MKRLFLIAFSVFLLGSASVQAGDGVRKGVVGKPLPSWTRGCLDIHAVNSARGECTFIIMPDGTTMVIDAGEFPTKENSKYAPVPQRPDESVRPYKVYAEYIRHFLPQGHGALDYFVLTHYHMDHEGTMDKSYATDPEGGYCLTGVAGLYDEIRFDKIVDRSYPDYSGKQLLKSTSKDVRFYVDFVNYNVSHRGLKAEKCEVGTDRQFPLLYDAAGYPQFKIFCYASNGIAWDGEKAVDCHCTRENARSSSLLFSYGPFEYFTSGDNNAETVPVVAKAIGHHLEAMKCTHHMSNPAAVGTEMDCFTPQVVITHSFSNRADQPHQDIIRKYEASSDLFFTNLDAPTVALDPLLYAGCRASNGHFVIRVCPGGKRFMVYQLDDTDMTYTVKAVFGPYFCKKR